eukprot:m.1607626 g.1607626  ORF g.1607626 m.1607626 type:complete len:305 (+) comp25362_c0_seq10:1166-2080(+)
MCSCWKCSHQKAAQITSPTVVQLPPHAANVCSVAAGMRHSVVVSTSNNAVFAWGSNKDGQLGLGAAPGIVPPTLVPLHRTGVIVGCAAGANHTALLTDIGTVLCCGSNKFGQCNVADSGRKLPHLQVADLGQCGDVSVRVSSVHCGWTHTAAVAWTGTSGEGVASTCGEGVPTPASPDLVFIWGRNNYGQLGVPADPVDTPRTTLATGTTASVTGSGTRGGMARHSFAHDGGVRALCTGSEHTLCLTTRGNIYAWGWNEHGMCATGDTVLCPNPTRIVPPRNARAATHVGCGAGFSLAVFTQMD